MQSFLKKGDTVKAVMVVKPDKSSRRIEGADLRSIIKKLDEEGNHQFSVDGEITVVEAQGERVSLSLATDTRLHIVLTHYECHFVQLLSTWHPCS